MSVQSTDFDFSNLLAKFKGEDYIFFKSETHSVLTAQSF